MILALLVSILLALYYYQDKIFGAQKFGVQKDEVEDTLKKKDKRKKKQIFQAPIFEKIK